MAVIIKAMKAIMGMNLSTSIVEGSATKDLKGSLRDTGTTSYEFTSSFRSTFIFLGELLMNPIKKNCVFSFESIVCDLYVKNIPIKVNKANPLGDLSVTNSLPLICGYSD